jgi:spore coat protein U-like protein
MRLRIVAAALATLVAGFASAPPLSAATQKQNTAVKINAAVSPECFVSTPAIAFNLGIGFVQAPGHSTSRQSALGVRCTKGAHVAVGLDRGLYAGSTDAQFGSRSMKLSTKANYMGYELCHDSACASVWSPSGYTYVSPADTGSSLPVWARVITGQRVFLGSYADSVTATLNF